MGAATPMGRIDSIAQEDIDKLLAIAQGGGTGGGCLMLHATVDEVSGVIILDKTAEETAAAALVGPVMCITETGSEELGGHEATVYMLFAMAEPFDGYEYKFDFYNFTLANTASFFAVTGESYPAIEIGDDSEQGPVS